MELLDNLRTKLLAILVVFFILPNQPCGAADGIGDRWSDDDEKEVKRGKRRKGYRSRFRFRGYVDGGFRQLRRCRGDLTTSLTVQ